MKCSRNYAHTPSFEHVFVRSLHHLAPYFTAGTAHDNTNQSRPWHCPRDITWLPLAPLILQVSAEAFIHACTTDVDVEARKGVTCPIRHNHTEHTISKRDMPIRAIVHRSRRSMYIPFILV